MSNLLEIKLKYSPYWYQKVFHKDTRRFRVIAGGRRVGKSETALHELILHCLTTPGALGWWVAPSYKDAKEVGFEKFKEHYEELSPAIKKLNETDLHCTFINGSQIYFKGCDNENSLRGRGITFCVIDEAAFVKEDVWTKALRPALSDKQGKCIMTSTPNGRNWYYLTFKDSAKPSMPWWSGYHWPTKLNPLISKEDLEEAQNSLADIDFRQEYLAEFVTKAGMVYDDFDDSNILPTYPPEIRLDSTDIFLGMDFGFANPTAICFMSVVNENLVVQFDEIYLSRTPIERIEELIVQKLRAHGLERDHVKAIFTDPAGNAQELSSGISPVDFLRGRGWQVINNASNVAPGLALVRSFVCSSTGTRSFYMTRNCIDTIRSFEGYSYKLGLFKRPTEEPDKDNVHDHACDSVRYFFVNRFDKAKYIFSNLNQYAYGSKANLKAGKKMKRCSVPSCKQPFLSSTPKGQAPYICSACYTRGVADTPHAGAPTKELQGVR